MICPKCGVESPDNLKFCPFCGEQLAQQGKSRLSLEKKRDSGYDQNPSLYSQDPQHAPNQYAPNQYVPNQYAPNQYAQNQYAQNQYAPNQYAPNQYAQNQYAQNQYAQNPGGSIATLSTYLWQNILVVLLCLGIWNIPGIFGIVYSVRATIAKGKNDDRAFLYAQYAKCLFLWSLVCSILFVGIFMMGGLLGTLPGLEGNLTSE